MTFLHIKCSAAMVIVAMVIVAMATYQAKNLVYTVMLKPKELVSSNLYERCFEVLSRAD